MSEVSEAIQEKCLAFSDRIIKLNDYLLKEAANAKPTYKIVKGKRVYEKSVALKEARESLYWLDLLHRNGYLTDVQFNSLYTDCEELVKVLTHRCKKLDGVE